MTNSAKIGPMLRLVLAVGAVLQPLARPLLKRRLARGKEDPKRWREKLGQTDAVRPDGPLIWMHGVGVGEVMALRGLIADMSAKRDDLQFLITSSARSSGDVFAKNMPARTRHQYLPLDLPGPVAAFYDHWRPDLAVWSDQEVWPRLAVEATRRTIPQAYVAARITNASAKAKARFGHAYGDLFRLMNVRHAQDQGTATHLATLMGDDTPVQVTGSLKAASAPLTHVREAEAVFNAATKGRTVWLLASSHEGDEAIAIAAHAKIRAHDPSALLIIAPRDLTRAAHIAGKVQDTGLTASLRSAGDLPDTDVYIADTFGELGLWYRRAQAGLIGGTFGATEGHNPWEAVALNCPVLHGPRYANFQTDFDMLSAAGAARLVKTPGDVAQAVLDTDLSAMARRAHDLRTTATKSVERISEDLLALLAR